jgi:hypothetical protein
MNRIQMSLLAVCSSLVLATATGHAQVIDPGSVGGHRSEFVGTTDESSVRWLPWRSAITSLQNRLWMFPSMTSMPALPISRTFGRASNLRIVPR